MKKTILFMAILIMNTGCYVQANDYDPRAELFVGNLTSKILYVRLLPTGTVFNGFPKDILDDTTSYNLIRKFSGTARRRYPPDININHLMGLDGVAISLPGTQYGFFKIDKFNGNPQEWNNFVSHPSKTLK